MDTSVVLPPFPANYFFTKIGLKIIFLHTAEAVAGRYSVEKVFLEIWQNSQENTCGRASFSIKLQALGVGYETSKPMGSGRNEKL